MLHVTCSFTLVIMLTSVIISQEEDELHTLCEYQTKKCNLLMNHFLSSSYMISYAKVKTYLGGTNAR